MKIKHRIPVEHLRLSDPVTPDYQAEVDATIAKAAKRERDAQRRLEAAEHRLAKVEQQHGRKSRVHAVQVAREIVEIRRQELLALQRLAYSSPASAAHRGMGHKKRPVPGINTL